MKKLLLTALLVMLSVVDVYSEPFSINGTAPKFGVKVKPHFARIFCSLPSCGVIVSEADFKLSGGPFGEYAFNDMAAGQVSLEYSGQGDRNIDEPDKTKNYHYLMVTLTPRVYVDEYRQFCLFVGPRISRLFAVKAQSYTSDGKKEGDSENLSTEPLTRYNFGVLAGLDYEFKRGFLLGADINIGLTDNMEQSEDDTTSTLSYGVTLGYNLAKLLKQ